jgi:PKD repeat protein
VNGSTSTDDVAVVSYTWDWGNGKTETHVGSTSSNTWAASGTYNVTLTVRDGSGLTGTVTQSVVVP